MKTIGKLKPVQCARAQYLKYGCSHFTRVVLCHGDSFRGLVNVVEKE